MKKIIIFGATGSIGAYLIDYCNAHINHSDYELYAVGRKDTDFFNRMDINYIKLDVCNENDFKKLPQEEVYAIINLVGVLPAYTSKFNPYLYIDTNITGSIRILEYARRVNADRVLYTQTWSDQGGYWGIKEILSPDLPRNLIYTGDHAFYAITKSMIVDTMEHYKQEYGIKSFVFRLPNVYMYHPEQYYFVDGIKKNVGYRYMIERAIQGKPIELWGDPDAFKDVLYIKDLCQMMYKALFVNINGGMYNAGTGIKTTLKQQIEGIIEVFSQEDKASKIVSRPEKKSFTSFVMNIDKLTEELDYHPRYDYIKYLEDYKKERDLKRFNELWDDNIKNYK